MNLSFAIIRLSPPPFVGTNLAHNFYDSHLAPAMSDAPLFRRYAGPGKTLQDFVQTASVREGQEDVQAKVIRIIKLRHKTVDGRAPDQFTQQMFFLGVLWAVADMCDATSFADWYSREPLFTPASALQRLEALYRDAESKQQVSLIDPRFGTTDTQACTTKTQISQSQIRRLHLQCFYATLRYWRRPNRLLIRRWHLQPNDDGINHARELFDYIASRQSQSDALCKSLETDARLDEIRRRLSCMVNDPFMTQQARRQKALKSLKASSNVNNPKRVKNNNNNDNNGGLQKKNVNGGVRKKNHDRGAPNKNNNGGAQKKNSTVSRSSATALKKQLRDQRPTKPALPPISSVYHPLYPSVPPPAIVCFDQNALSFPGQLVMMDFRPLPPADAF